jgi:hypothetical protein
VSNSPARTSPDERSPQPPGTPSPTPTCSTANRQPCTAAHGQEQPRQRRQRQQLERLLDQTGNSALQQSVVHDNSDNRRDSKPSATTPRALARPNNASARRATISTAQHRGDNGDGDTRQVHFVVRLSSHKCAEDILVAFLGVSMRKQPEDRAITKRHYPLVKVKNKLVAHDQINPRYAAPLATALATCGSLAITFASDRGMPTNWQVSKAYRYLLPA